MTVPRRLGRGMSIASHVTAVLTPHLGAFTADTVARHVCAKLQIADSADAEQLDRLREFLRRGLVAYVGPEVADTLASECVAQSTRGGSPSSEPPVEAT